MKPMTLPLSKLYSQLMTLYERVKTDNVIRNSLYLMASTGVMAVFGFVFWLVGARIYPTDQIGLSSTLVNATTTLGMLSMLGFDNVLVRYLPTSRQPNRMIDTSIISVVAASLLLASIFIASLSVVAPSIHGVIDSPERIAFFLLIMTVLAINTLTDSVFISYQAAQYILFADIGLSITKLALPIMLVGLGGFGLFAGFGASILVATIISLAILARRFKYVFHPTLDRATLREVRKFSLGTYASNLIAALPLLVLPIMVTNALGATSAAYFNLAMTIAAAVFIIPHSAANSLFAEGAKNAAAYARTYASVIRHMGVILAGVVLGVIVLGRFILSVFGAQYADGASSVLTILAVSALFFGYNTITTISFKIHHRLRALMIIELVATAIMLGAAGPFISLWGIEGAAIAWLTGQVVMAILLAIFAAKLHKPGQEVVL